MAVSSLREHPAKRPTCARRAMRAGSVPGMSRSWNVARGSRETGRGPRLPAMPSTDPVEQHWVTASDLMRWAETLSAIARTGLGFTQSLYERERFEEVL